MEAFKTVMKTLFSSRRIQLQEEERIKSIEEERIKSIEEERIKSKVDEFTKLYNMELLTVFINAKNSCRKITNSHCDNAIDIIPMLKMYKEIEENNEIQYYLKYRKDYLIIKNYLEKYIEYWKKVTEYPECLPKMYYPGRDEMLEFCTFHWSINTVKNISGIKENEKIVYKHIEDYLNNPLLLGKTRHKNDTILLSNYRKDIENNFIK